MNELSAQAWGILFIFVGLCLGLATYLVLRSEHGMKNLIIGLANIGPCTGRQLVKAGYARRGTVYVDLGVAMERGLVRARMLPLTEEELAIRGGISEQREFRLTTKGWSLSHMYGAEDE